MHHIGNHRLTRQLQRFAEGLAPGAAPTEPEGRSSAHDMLVMTSRPDLTPEFPAGLRHPSQADRNSSPTQLWR